MRNWVFRLRTYSYLLLRSMEKEMEVESSKVDVVPTSDPNDVNVGLLDNEEGKSSIVKVQYCFGILNM